MSELKLYSENDVKDHSTEDSLWIIIDGKVYDVTKFQQIHPGGKKMLQKVGGKDASKFFHKYHDVKRVMSKYAVKYRIGELQASPASGEVKMSSTSSELISANNASGKVPVPGATQFDIYGDNVPFGDPNWYSGYYTPYYNETHHALRKEVRAWVEENLEPFIDDWEAEGAYPESIYRSFGEQGYLASVIGTEKFPSDLTDKRLKAVPLDKFDVFHEMVIIDELCRIGSGGVVWFLVGGYSIGLPPVIKFARPELAKRIVPGIIAGEKRICLCITEPEAGSDVANITTTAKKTADGKHYVVNGTKKWITNGVWADYFTVAVRTGEAGMGGISVLLIEKSFPGVSVRKFDVQGVRGSGTTFIEFDDVKVPVENLIGKENKGFKVIMTNFNHERIGIIAQAARFSRVCYEEAIVYAHKRKTFGKRLIDHPVIRNKLGQMAIRIEGVQNWLENLAYQTQNFDDQEAMLRLGGPIAGLKALTTQTFEFCAREATQIFGGIGYTRGGRGGKVERLYRDVRAYAIPGGSEEIMLDLAIRQSLKVNEFLGSKI